MLRKFALLLLLLAGLHWLNACCGDSKPYFDYSGLSIVSSLLVLTASNDTVVTLRVSPDEIEYLASARLPAFTTPAYGGNCPQSGEEGPKHAMQSIEILADKDFNDTLPAGAPLTALFYDGRSATANQPLNENIADLEFILPNWDFVAYTPHKPKQMDQTFQLKVRVTKADGSVAQGVVNGVKFR